MSGPPAVPIVPGRGLGWMSLGASLHGVISRIKSQPQIYPNIDLSHSQTQPTTQPIILSLPANGLRLRFDCPDQRLRLIEVVDFSKTLLIYKNVDLVKQVRSQDEHLHQDPTQARPSFKHIYNRLFGPAYKGEYTPPERGHRTGSYTLSYPGLAFIFPIDHKSWSDKADFVSMLSSSATGPATSMAIFEGSSWPEARSSLFAASSVSESQSNDSPQESLPSEITLVQILGSGALSFLRRNGTATHIQLNHTTPQDLVAEFGPPDAIYRKNDTKLSIHAAAASSNQRRRGSSTSPNLDPLDNNTTDHSSARSYSGESDASAASSSKLHHHQDDSSTQSGVECFYNYFHHGFDALISYPSTHTSPSFLPSSSEPSPTAPIPPPSPSPSNLVVTKLILHGNIPSSYAFNRHRRLRWSIDHPSTPPTTITSETPFTQISQTLHSIFPTDNGNANSSSSSRGMVLNRGWDTHSPSSSIEILGGFEDPAPGKKSRSAGGGGGQRDDGIVGLGDGNNDNNGTTELFGFPGLLFEVLKNDCVVAVTVY